MGRQGGIIALHLDANHHADRTEHFGTVDGGTGIRFHDDRLYASTPSGVYRFTFRGNELVPSSEPDLIVDGMPASHPGFNRVNRPIAFDGKGNLFVALDGSANLCTEQTQPPPGRPLPATPPVGVKPCPDLATRAGVWRFDANKVGQKFPAAGEQWATGIRDIDSLDWSPADGHLYGIMHGRDNTNRLWPDLVSADDDFHIADEMHRITKLTDFGWPYTYYDGARNARLISPEYGGDGRKSPAPGAYSTPVLTFHSRRSAPVDLLFYSGKAFPARIAAARSSCSTARRTSTATTSSSCRSIATARQARRRCLPTGSRRSIPRPPLPGRRDTDRLELLRVPTERCTSRTRRRAASGGSRIREIHRAQTHPVELCAATAGSGCFTSPMRRASLIPVLHQAYRCRRARSQSSP